MFLFILTVNVKKVKVMLLCLCFLLFFCLFFAKTYVSEYEQNLFRDLKVMVNSQVSQ